MSYPNDITPNVGLTKLGIHEIMANNLDIIDSKLLPGAINVMSFGATGDGVTDDTVAIQVALTSLSIQNNQVNKTLFFPTGSYKISNMLVYEGGDGTALRIVGENAPPFLSPNAGNYGTQLSWDGPAGDTMLLLLGANGMQIEQLGLQANGVASNCLWVDATNTISAVTYTITSISRSGNIVTATIGSNSLASPLIIKVAGVQDSSYDGTFRVLYTGTNTASWIQGGLDSSSNGGTCVKYKSTPTAVITLRNCAFYNPASTVTSVISITGTFPNFTLTTSTPHYLNAGDYVIYTGGTNATYAPNVWEVSAVTGATTATLTTTGVLTSLLPTWSTDNGLGTTGGTIQSDACGLRLGHRNTPPALSNITAYDTVCYGLNGQSLCAFKCDQETTSNTKDFQFFNTIVEGFQYGLAGFDSGSLFVYGYGGFLSTPQTSPILACVDFANCGGGALQATYIAGAETEAVNNRFWVGSGMVHIDGCSIECSGPTDDIVLYGGGLILTASTFTNQRASTSVPKIVCINPLQSAGNSVFPGYVVAMGCIFSNSNSLGTGPTPGSVTIEDNSGNYLSGAFYVNKAVSITTLSCFGTADYLDTTHVSALNNIVAGQNSLMAGTVNLTADTPVVATGQVGLGTTTSATASSGGETLPDSPAGFLQINIGGTAYKLPYYPS